MQERNILNFRFSNPLKDEFQVPCRQLQSNMTAKLNYMTRQFVQEHCLRAESMRPLKWFSSNKSSSK